MTNLSKIKRQEMLSFLEELRACHTDDDSIRAITEIENYIRDKKYGLVWEEHEERVDAILKDNIPIFIEDTDKKITAVEGEPYNFILEGDNLQSLYLLEKTHKGAIDLIYIDPPYNTGNEDFIYDDNFISPDDGYRHSKWISFINERLRLAYHLLSDEGMIMISIDDNEIAQLKLLCDEIFGENNLISIHHLQVRYAQKSLADGKAIKPVMEYVLIYAKNASKVILNLPEEDYTDEKFVFEIKELSEGEIIKADDGTEMTVFKPGQWSIKNKEPSINLLKETWISGTIYTKMSYGQVVRKYIEPRYEIDGTGCLYKIMGRGDDGLGYRYYVGPQKSNATRCKMYSGMPLERVEEVKCGLAKRKIPLTNYYDYAADFGNIVNEGAVTFNSGKKPVKMLKELISYLPKKENITILDFFAGSGSTGEAVMDLNNEDGGRRNFILCTSNEVTKDARYDYFIKKGYMKKKPRKNTAAEREWLELWEDFLMSDDYATEVFSDEYQALGICRAVTYPRIKTVITGKKPNGAHYSDGMNANLKYFKCDWIPRKPEDHLLSNALCLHIKEMIELQNGIEVDNVRNVLILNKDDYRKYIMDEANYPQIENIWVNQNIIFNSAEMEKLNALGFQYIPREYFGQELREAAE